MDILAYQFEEELKEKMFRAKKECKYNPTRFNQMLSRYGGVETAKRLIDTAIQTGNTSDGFATLLICGRLDLTVEHSVCKREYAHYNNNAYKKPFRYLLYDKDRYALKEGDREQLFQKLLNANIPYSIEPGVSLQSCEEVLQLCAEYPGRIFPAMGIHPTRSIYEKWSDRKKLDAFAKTPGVIAIGECGLDYHYKREEQHRLKQHIWFLYQLNLTWRLKKPVILHVRDAHEDALRILKWHPARKLGGVIHCFYGSWEIAQQYLKLDYHFGIGGSLLQQEERAGALWEAVKHIPLDKILI